MDISVKEALTLKGQLKAAVVAAEQEVGRARVTNTFEESTAGSEVNITDSGAPLFLEAVANLVKVQAQYLELECRILEHNMTNEITYLVRHRNLAGKLLKILEGRLDELVERRTRSTPYNRTDETVKFTIERPIYTKAQIKVMIKGCKLEMRNDQAAIDRADALNIHLDFNYEDLD